jgi:hypothetical protein
MKGIDTNGLFALGAGAIELVAVDVLKGVLGMGVVGIVVGIQEDSPHCPSSRSQSSFISRAKPTAKSASDKRWWMSRA